MFISFEISDASLVWHSFIHSLGRVSSPGQIDRLHTNRDRSSQVIESIIYDTYIVFSFNIFGKKVVHLGLCNYWPFSIALELISNHFVCFNIFFRCAPFGYLYFSYFSIMSLNWVQESILAWIWPHFHLLYSKYILYETRFKPTTFDHESSLITTRPDWHPLMIILLW